MANRYFEGEAHAAAYTKFRPQPPSSLISSIISFLKEEYSGNLETAADVGCGSGQGTVALTEHFSSVTGLDISEAQISEAIKHLSNKGISFKVSGAETIPFPPSSLQLVTSCQACHWFDIPAFYKEVDRVLVPGGVIALYGYSLPRPVNNKHSKELAKLIDHVYAKDLIDYFGSEAKEVDNEYSSAKFTLPYKAVVRENTHYIDEMTSVADITGSVTAWSGFQNFRAKNGNAAAQKLLEDFQEKFMTIMDVSTTPEDTPVCIRTSFFLIMGRKSLN